MQLNNDENSFYNNYNQENLKNKETNSDYSDAEDNQDYKHRVKKLEQEYKNCSFEYENQIENLSSIINTKNSQIEDLHLRIKLAQEEYEEILVRSNNDKKLIQNLQENISKIKKENDIKIESLNNELKDLKAGLDRRDYLSNEIHLYKEKFEKALTELNTSKHANEALEHNSNGYCEAIAKLNTEFQQKEREIQLINIKKKEIENELIKYSEKYGFNINSKLFRNYSVSNFDGDVKKLLTRKSTSLYDMERRTKKSFLRKSTLDSDFLGKANLQSIYENSDDSEAEKYDTNLNMKQGSVNDNPHFRKQEFEENNYINEEELDEQPLENSFEDKDDDIIEENNVRNSGLIGANILKSLKKANLKSVFEANENLNRNFTQLAIDYNDKNQDRVSDHEENTGNIINEKNFIKNFIKKENIDEQNKNRQNDFKQLDKDEDINCNRNLYCNSFENSKTIEVEKLNKIEQISSIENINEESKISLLTNNSKLKKRVSLKEIIDADLDDFDKGITRRQSIRHYNSDFSIKYMNSDLKKAFEDKIIKNFNDKEANYVERYLEKQLTLNKYLPEKLEISNYSIEIKNKNSDYNKENLMINTTDYLQKLTTVDSDNGSEYIISELKMKIEELSLRNIELQYILSNEQFISASELKMKQCIIQKLVFALNDIKNRIKSQN